ncbi:MAG TPA: hypothetical protein VGK67_36310 [Myxococcales bacterium]|jgi:hypothetical protein
MERVETMGRVFPAQAQVPVFRWGAVFAGAFVAMGLWVLLYAFGLAVGLNSLDMSNPKAIGTFTGIWSFVAPLISLFVGGLVAARGAGPVDRTVGILHGAVVWGLTTVAGVLLVGMLASALVSGLASAGAGAAQAVAKGVGGSGAGAGLSANDLLGPVNQKLQAEGKPAVTEQQVENSIRSLGNTAIAGGKIDENAFAQALSQNTNLSRQDALEIARNAQQKLSGAVQGLQQGAVQVANVSGKAFWGIFAALALGLIFALLGGAAGVSRKQAAATV